MSSRLSESDLGSLPDGDSKPSIRFTLGKDKKGQKSIGKKTSQLTFETDDTGGASKASKTSSGEAKPKRKVKRVDSDGDTISEGESVGDIGTGEEEDKRKIIDWKPVFKYPNKRAANAYRLRLKGKRRSITGGNPHMGGFYNYQLTK